MPRWDSNPQSQQASGRRPTPQTARYVFLLYQIYMIGLRKGGTLYNNVSILCSLEIVSFKAAKIALHDYWFYESRIITLLTANF